MANAYGKTSELKLKFEYDGSKTILRDVYFTTPLKIARPFRLDFDERLVALVMSASPALMAGDTQNFDIEVCEKADAIVTSQAYEKIHKMAEDTYAKRTCIAKVHKNARFNYLPLPAIPFTGASYRSYTDIYLEDNTSKLIFNDILACGRLAMGEEFEYNEYRSVTNVYQGDKLIFRDNTRYNPKTMDMNGFGFYEGYSHLSNYLLFNFDDIEGLRKKAIEFINDSKEDIQGGATVLECGGLMVRLFGRSGDVLEKINKSVTDLLG